MSRSSGPATTAATSTRRGRPRSRTPAGPSPPQPRSSTARSRCRSPPCGARSRSSCSRRPRSSRSSSATRPKNCTPGRGERGQPGRWGRNHHDPARTVHLTRGNPALCIRSRCTPMTPNPDTDLIAEIPRAERAPRDPRLRARKGGTAVAPATREFLRRADPVLRELIDACSGFPRLPDGPLRPPRRAALRRSRAAAGSSTPTGSTTFSTHDEKGT